MFRLTSTTSEKLNATVLPKGRNFHSACVWNDALIIFGGKSNSYLNDVWIYQNGDWKIAAKMTPAPTPRYGHSAVVYNQHMFVYGGYDNDGFVCDELWIFDLNTQSWKEHKIIAQLPALFQHSATVVDGNKMVLIGGLDSKKQANKTIFVVDLDTLQVVQSTSMDVSCYGHQALLVHNDNILIFGDASGNVVKLLDVKSWKLEDANEWTVKNQEIFIPFVRGGLVSDDELVLFGGITQVVTRDSSQEELLKFIDLLSSDILIHALEFLPKQDLQSFIGASKKWRLSKLAKRKRYIL
jgi:hypothetical protein